MAGTEVGRFERIVVPLAAITLGALLSLGATHLTASDANDHSDEARREERRADRYSEMLTTFREAINDLVGGVRSPEGFGRRFPDAASVAERTTQVDAAAVAAMILSDEDMEDAITECNDLIRAALASAADAPTTGPLARAAWDAIGPPTDRAGDCTDHLIGLVQKDLTG